MSTTTGTTSSSQSLVLSAAFRTFAVVFAIATPVIYVICEMRNWPLFTYHPATDRIDLFYAASRRDEGPAMHWYGWTANTLIGAGTLGFVATMFGRQSSPETFHCHSPGSCRSFAFRF